MAWSTAAGGRPGRRIDPLPPAAARQRVLAYASPRGRVRNDGSDCDTGAVEVVASSDAIFRNGLQLLTVRPRRGSDGCGQGWPPCQAGAWPLSRCRPTRRVPTCRHAGKPDDDLGPHARAAPQPLRHTCRGLSDRREPGWHGRDGAGPRGGSRRC